MPVIKAHVTDEQARAIAERITDLPHKAGQRKIAELGGIMRRKKTSVSLDEELKIVADQYAAEQNRTLSNYIEHLLRSDLKRRGMKVPPTRFERFPVQGTANNEKIEGSQ